MVSEKKNKRLRPYKIHTELNKGQFKKFLAIQKKYNLSRYGTAKYIINNFDDSIPTKNIAEYKEEVEEKPSLIIKNIVARLREESRLVKSGQFYHITNRKKLLGELQLRGSQVTTQECILLLSNLLKIEICAQILLDRKVKLRDVELRDVMLESIQRE